MLKQKALNSAFFVVLLIVVFLSGFAVYKSGDDPSYCYHQYQDKPQEIEACNKDISDTKLTNYTGLLVVATLFLAIISIVQIVYLVGADETARRTAQAALDANRPWLDFIVDIRGPIESHFGNDLRVIFDFRITNDGNSPAIEANVRVDLVCHRNHLRPDNKIAVGRLFSIFPKHTVHAQGLGMLTQYDIKQGLGALGPDNLIAIIAIMTVNHKFTGGQGQTVKNFRIIGKNMLEGVRPVAGETLVGLQHQFDTAT